MCKEYSFYYWQDYLDHHALFDRYVISSKKDAEKGPLPVEAGKISVQQEDTVIVHYDSEDWIDETKTKLFEIMTKLEIKDS